VVVEKNPGGKKALRNLRALVVLAVGLNLFVACAGGVILKLGYAQREVTQPLWKFGQYILILGLINGGLCLGLFWQTRRALSAKRE
jgi:hypothetical protein